MSLPEGADRWFELNRELWDERVPIHVGGDFYDVEGWLAGREALRPFEVEILGDVSGRTLFHPQCHFGQDTLSWARRGATVTGLDFSEPAVLAARELARRAGIDDATFLHADVYDAVDAVGGRTFDVVYTGQGAINWLPDLQRWADTMAAVCRPGGTFFVTEFHPVVDMLAATVHEECTFPPTLLQDYFGHYWHDGPEVTGTYADLSAHTEHNETWERVWTIGEVVSAIAGAGFHIEVMQEHDHTLYPAFPYMERHEDGSYRMPEGSPSMPMMYSIRASRPPGASVVAGP